LGAVFENAVFRPLQRSGIAEGERVHLTIERVGHTSGDDVLRLATQVYAGLSSADIDEIERIARRSIAADKPRR
jgi:predicted DNA-binding antitoxin AbrB/MazE fold protein